MDIAGPCVEAVTDEEIHVANHRRLAGEVSSGGQSTIHRFVRFMRDVEGVTEADDGYGRVDGLLDGVVQRVDVRLDAFHRHVEQECKVVDGLWIRIPHHSDFEGSLDDLQWQQVVMPQVFGRQLVREGQGGAE